MVLERSPDPTAMIKRSDSLQQVHACSRGGEDERVFLDAVRLAARLEAEWQPGTPGSGDGPRLDADVFAVEVLLPAAGRAAQLQRIGKLLTTEHWGWTGRGETPDGVWHFTVGRNVRKLRQVRDIEDYWKHPHPPETTSPAPFLDTGSIDAGHEDRSQSTGVEETPSFEAVLGYLHPMIRAVAQPRLRDGYGDNAVEGACKLVTERLREMTGLQHDGIDLVNLALGGKAILALADRSTDQGRNDHDGHANLLRGLLQVGRNLRAHRPSPASHDELEVVRLLLLASLCLTRLEKGCADRRLTECDPGGR